MSAIENKKIEDERIVQKESESLSGSKVQSEAVQPSIGMLSIASYYIGIFGQIDHQKMPMWYKT